MDAINRNSRTSVHFQLGFVLAVPWTPDKTSTVDFQRALLDSGLEFTQTNRAARSYTLNRTEPSNLHVKLDSPAPQLSGIQIIAQNPSCDLDMFVLDASAVTDAYQQTFTAGRYQIVRASAKIQHLYSSHEHAFKYLWESRLGQSGKDFKCLGPRPVAGGGLRLLMPPHAVEGQEPISIEIRIESFLREPTKLLIETNFVWPQPKLLQKDQKFDPSSYLNPLEEYAADQVWEFLTQSKDKQP
jgi:hypothetical protein